MVSDEEEEKGEDEELDEDWESGHSWYEEWCTLKRMRKRTSGLAPLGVSHTCMHKCVYLISFQKVAVDNLSNTGALVWQPTGRTILTQKTTFSQTLTFHRNCRKNDTIHLQTGSLLVSLLKCHCICGSACFFFLPEKRRLYYSTKENLSLGNQRREESLVSPVTIPRWRWGGWTNCGISSLQDKKNPLMEEAKKVKRERDRNWVKQEWTDRPSLDGERSDVVSNSVPSPIRVSSHHQRFNRKKQNLPTY